MRPQRSIVSPSPTWWRSSRSASTPDDPGCAASNLTVFDPTSMMPIFIHHALWPDDRTPVRSPGDRLVNVKRRNGCRRVELAAAPARTQSRPPHQHLMGAPLALAVTARRPLPAAVGHQLPGGVVAQDRIQHGRQLLAGAAV